MDADDAAKQIVDAMKGHGDISNIRYLSGRLDAFAEDRTVYYREMNRLLKEEITDDHNELAEWMIKLGFATGHGDSTADLLIELEWQIEEKVGGQRHADMEILRQISIPVGCEKGRDLFIAAMEKEHGMV